MQQSKLAAGWILSIAAACNGEVKRQRLASYVAQPRTGKSEVVSRTWSVHQYQIEAGVCPRRKAGQGMSDVTASRSIHQASARG